MLLNLLCLLFFTPGLNSPPKVHGDLYSYFNKPEPAYQWTLKHVSHESGATIYDLQMTSLVWHGITWKHQLQVITPAKPAYPHFCTLFISGGDSSPKGAALGVALARSTGCTFATLYDIPNQPLFGRYEDALVAYTWLKFLETGDASWPLHLPMAKAGLKGMDTVQALTKQEHLPYITGFLIVGGSKEGWSTWLDGASGDPRIKAIAPMVIDTLNLPAQFPHELAAFGKFSSQIDDYTKADIPAKIKTPMGKRLVQLEDPYSYRKQLTLPKLLILGTNDKHWTQDALNLYWNGLRGPKWVMYDPNSGHSLEDLTRVLNTLTAYIRSIASNHPFPKMQWAYRQNDKGVELMVRSAPVAISARLFRVYAPTQDFRKSTWTSKPMTLRNGVWEGHLAMPVKGYAAMFGEESYTQDGKQFTLSTQIRIIGRK